MSYYVAAEVFEFVPFETKLCVEITLTVRFHFVGVQKCIARSIALSVWRKTPGKTFDLVFSVLGVFCLNCNLN